MRILGLDSSGLVASVAVVQDGLLLAENTVNYKKTHSQTLLPMLDEIARRIELDLNSIDAIAVAAGPGSFTGLRIGAATAKGLGLALDKPLVAVPTVEALAYNLWGCERLICPLMDARRSQVYTGLYRFREDRLETLEDQMAVSVEELAQMLNARKERVVFLGDGVPVYLNVLEEKVQVSHSYAPANLNRQRAASVAALGLVYAKQGRLEAAAEHQPVYLRLSQAEQDRAAKEEAGHAARIEVFAMQMEDLEQVSAIEMESFSVPWSKEGFAASLRAKNTCYLTVWVDGEIAGYCGMILCMDEAEITNVAVSERFRRRGAAQTMLRELIACGYRQGVRKFLLEVRESNKAAIALYEKLGFQKEGIRKNFYEKPLEDAVIMWKR